MNFCAFDIETIPNPDLPKECIPQFDPDSVKLGNIKDTEKAEAKIRLEQKIFNEGLIKKMSLDPDLARVVCVAWGWNENNKFWIDTRTHKNNLIEYTWQVIRTQYIQHIPLITFNGLSFDLPVLWHSAIRLGIPVDPQMYKDLTKKYDNRYHYDIMELLGSFDVFSRKPRRHSLDFYLSLFGIGKKDGDGSMVYEWWTKKEYEKIRQYCEHDVDMLVKLWEKIEGYVREKEE